MARLGIERVNAILLDLGISSAQLDDAARGFSFQSSGPLDMRMDSRELMTASTIVNTYPRQELEKIFWEFGEERHSRRIAARIVEERSGSKIETTRQLADLVSRAVPSYARHRRLHPATRTFQALRLVVNREIESLEAFLLQVTEVLESKARIVILSFHSLEDRIVKNTFRRWKASEWGVILTKKPIRPTQEEVRLNPRSRSARLRAFEKR